MAKPSVCKGFTLVELMIVLAIIGILASIAYPSYVEFVRSSNRGEAQAMLMENAHFMERYFTANGTYVGASPPNAQAPASGTKRYSLTASTPSATTYTLSAAPATGYSDPKCGTLTLNQAGTQTENGTGSLGDCWRN